MSGMSRISWRDRRRSRGMKFNMRYKKRSRGVGLAGGRVGEATAVAIG